VSKNLIELCHGWELAKLRESEAREARVELEAQISELVGQKTEGTVSTRAGDYKVSVTYRINRSVDEKKWAEVAPLLPENVANHLLRYKPSLVMKGFRYLEENKPDLFKLVSKAVTEKPSKPTVTISHAEDPK